MSLDRCVRPKLSSKTQNSLRFRGVEASARANANACGGADAYAAAWACGSSCRVARAVVRYAGVKPAAESRSLARSRKQEVDRKSRNANANAITESEEESPESQKIDNQKLKESRKKP